MANENTLPFPAEALKGILPGEGDTVKLGEASFTKIEYQGKAYIIHWATAIHILATAGFEELEKETKSLEERGVALDKLVAQFNELQAVPVKAQ